MPTRKPKRYDPIARDIKALREARGETQLEFSAHFGVGRTTIISWEQYGPPAYGPIRAHVKLTLKRLTPKGKRTGAKNGKAAAAA